MASSDFEIPMSDFGPGTEHRFLEIDERIIKKKIDYVVFKLQYYSPQHLCPKVC